VVMRSTVFWNTAPCSSLEGPGFLVSPFLNVYFVKFFKYCIIWLPDEATG
jgi:hypothetical protein